jgi:hypothetical protein
MVVEYGFGPVAGTPFAHVVPTGTLLPDCPWQQNATLQSATSFAVVLSWKYCALSPVVWGVFSARHDASVPSKPMAEPSLRLKHWCILFGAAL